MELEEKYKADPQQYKTTGVASRVGDLMGLQQMVWNGRPIDVFDNRGWSPLHEAAHGGFSGCLEFLLRQPDADPNWKNHEQETAILLAARQGHCTCMRALVNAQADIGLATNEGFTPLYEAVKSRSHECIRLLVKKGANVNYQAKISGFTPLHLAASAGRAQVTAYLLQQGAKQELQCNNGLTPLFLAAQTGSLDTARVLLRHAHANTRDSDLDVVNLPAFDNATPLLIAAQEGHAEVVDLLLDHSADANVKVTETQAGPLQYAINCGHEKCVSSLLPVTDLQSFEDDYGYMHPLVQSLKWPSTAILQLLLDADLDPKAVRSVDGVQRAELRTLSEGLPERFVKASLLCHILSGAPLHCATHLLTKGALSPNSTQVNGGHELLPLVAAMIRGHFPLFCLLLQHGARPNLYYTNVAGNVAVLYALHYDLQFWSDEEEEESVVVAAVVVEDNKKDSDSSPGADSEKNGSSNNSGTTCVSVWLDRRKRSYLLRLFAAGGEVESVLRESAESQHWGLRQLLARDLNVGAVGAVEDGAGDREEDHAERSRSRAAAVLALLLSLSYNVAAVPASLLGLVSVDQAKKLNNIAEKTNTLAHLCRLHIFRRLCVKEDKLEKAVSSLGLPQTVRDYLLFPELMPYSQTLWTLLAQSRD